MAKKIITYHGKQLDELQKMTLQEFVQYVPSRQRRTLLRGLSDQEKILLREIEFYKAGKRKKPVKTHCRSMIILPSMVGIELHVYTGKEFLPVMIQEEMIGTYLGEYALTRTRVKHSAPGIGATRSSSSASVK